MLDTMDIYQNVGVEVLLKDQDSFLKVKETLTRIGIPSFQKKTLVQSCIILHKRGHYRILGFKEAFLLDGKESTFTQDDKARRNLIVSLLVSWKLVTLANPNEKLEPIAPINSVKILSHGEKGNWQLKSKYQVGKKHRVFTEVA